MRSYADYSYNLKGIPKLPKANVKLKPCKCCSTLHVTNYMRLVIID